MEERILLEQLAELKEAIEEAKEAKAKAEGRLEEIMRTIREKWGVKTLGEAEEKLRQIREAREELQATLTEELNRLMEEIEQLEERDD